MEYLICCSWHLTRHIPPKKPFPAQNVFLNALSASLAKTNNTSFLEKIEKPEEKSFFNIAYLVLQTSLKFF